ncbi:efflux transporter outer membrane subunit, partial [Sphingomonas sp. UBA4815]|uniref:efflux transporter outer membrane subunit n=1 Tax=Sphingomonas sp. UBA4815 TaxID=1947533 RepID=UPI0031F59895
MTMRCLPLTLLLATTACSMTPRLTLPTPPVAEAYPIASGAEALPEWRGMFGDPRLQSLIALSLDANRDLRIAALNAEGARAQVRVQRAQSLPGVNVDAGYTRQRQPASVAGAGVGLTPGSEARGFEFGQFSAQAALTSFEIDLFGRLRAMNEAAFHRWLASVEARRAVRLAVIGAVADAYWNERLADEQLALTRSTLADWRASLDITRLRKDAGQASGADLAQAEGLVRQAQADLAQRERELAQATNALTLAVGAPLPNDLLPPTPLMDQPIRIALAAGTRSDLLTRRPDIAQAEQRVVSADASLAAARDQLLPSLQLTAAGTLQGLSWDQLFNAPYRLWSIGGSILTPVLQGNRLRASTEVAAAQRDQAVFAYEQSVRNAFAEVENALASIDALQRQLVQTEAREQASTEALRVVRNRYRNGYASYLEELDAQRTNYAAQQAVVQTRATLLTSYVDLYRALG